jgi:hypothetical protein
MNLDKRIGLYKEWVELTKKIEDGEVMLKPFRDRREDVIKELALHYNIPYNDSTDDKTLQAVIYEVGHKQLHGL